MTKLRIFLLVMLIAGVSSTSASALIITLHVPPVLSFEDGSGPFGLSFSDFLQGSRSNVQTVTYRIRANQLNPGTFSNAVSIRLSEMFAYAELEAKVQSYQNMGASDFAALEGARHEFQAVEAADTPLADKRAGRGTGDYCLDGQLTIAYRAVLKEAAPAGTENRSVVVTVHDGN